MAPCKRILDKKSTTSQAPRLSHQNQLTKYNKPSTNESAKLKFRITSEKFTSKHIYNKINIERLCAAPNYLHTSLTYWHSNATSAMYILCNPLSTLRLTHCKCNSLMQWSLHLSVLHHISKTKWDRCKISSPLQDIGVTEQEYAIRFCTTSSNNFGSVRAYCFAP